VRFYWFDLDYILIYGSFTILFTLPLPFCYVWLFTVIYVCCCLFVYVDLIYGCWLRYVDRCWLITPIAVLRYVCFTLVDLLRCCVDYVDCCWFIWCCLLVVGWCWWCRCCWFYLLAFDVVDSHVLVFVYYVVWLRLRWFVWLPVDLWFVGCSRCCLMLPTLQLLRWLRLRFVERYVVEFALLFTFIYCCCWLRCVDLRWFTLRCCWFDWTLLRCSHTTFTFVWLHLITTFDYPFPRYVYWAHFDLIPHYTFTLVYDSLILRYHVAFVYVAGYVAFTLHWFTLRLLILLRSGVVVPRCWSRCCYVVGELLFVGYVGDLITSPFVYHVCRYYTAHVTTTTFPTPFTFTRLVYSLLPRYGYTVTFALPHPTLHFTAFTFWFTIYVYVRLVDCVTHTVTVPFYVRLPRLFVTLIALRHVVTGYPFILIWFTIYGWLICCVWFVPYALGCLHTFAVTIYGYVVATLVTLRTHDVDLRVWFDFTFDFTILILVCGFGCLRYRFVDLDYDFTFPFILLTLRLTPRYVCDLLRLVWFTVVYVPVAAVTATFGWLIYVTFTDHVVVWFVWLYVWRWLVVTFTLYVYVLRCRLRLVTTRLLFVPLIYDLRLRYDLQRFVVGCCCWLRCCWFTIDLRFNLRCWLPIYVVVVVVVVVALRWICSYVTLICCWWAVVAIC